MLDMNQLLLSSNLKSQKEKTDLIIRSWKSEHEEEYTTFKKRIDNIVHGDLSVLDDLFLLVEECMPSEEECQPIPFALKPITEFRDEIWAQLPLSVKVYIADFAKNNIEGYTKNNSTKICKELVTDCLSIL